LRASQINGCAFCCDSAVKAAKNDGESDERLATVAAWRHAQYFSEAERAVLALTEALTRIADREDPVTDAIWDDVKRHFDEPAVAGIVLAIATVNVWNRANVAIRQQPGAW
jgi:AhpD family alkylhydroperoxidase